MNKLDQLALVSRKIFAGKMRGERITKRRGESVEFADYRNYVRGDDLRALDWNIFARLERPFIKLFEEEVDQSVHLLLDASASMNWPLDPGGLIGRGSEQNKWRYGRRLVAGDGAHDIGKQAGLHYVFVGNVSDADRELTYCPECGKQLIRRHRYLVNEHWAERGVCPDCSHAVAGVWA